MLVELFPRVLDSLTIRECVTHTSHFTSLDLLSYVTGSQGYIDVPTALS
jgi:hypothetical protein